jgi:type II secretory pathway component PulF
MCQQLGADLPAVTEQLTEFGRLMYGVPSSWIVFFWLALACALVVFFLTRAMMNGSLIARYLIALGLVSLAADGCLMMIQSSPDSPGGEMRFVVVGLVLTVIAVLLTPGLPWVLGWVEQAVLRTERCLAPLLRLLPFVGRAAQAQAEAQWQAALAVALSSGVTAPEALRAAGAVCGGGYRKSSDYAAVLVEKGHSIGEACTRGRVLRAAACANLVLIDHRSDYAAGLKALADDAASQAYETLYRTARLAEIVGTILVAVVLVFWVLGLYLPLFHIPRVVGGIR